MSLRLQQADFFWADLERRVDWYRDYAGPEISDQFVIAVEVTLKKLAETPGLGRPRFT